jgi:hypothetical protein
MEMVEPANSCAAVWCGVGFFAGSIGNAALSVRCSSLAYADLEDDGAGIELPDDAVAREFAAKVMRGLVQQEDDWHGWTMEVRQGGRRVWQLPFDAIEPTSD